jgi:hypothetical protein
MFRAKLAKGAKFGVEIVDTSSFRFQRLRFRTFIRLEQLKSLKPLETLEPGLCVLA